MANPLRMIACAGLTAGAVYYFDPLLGRRRRSLLRDQWTSMTVRSLRAADVAYRDSINRLHGVLAETQSAFAGSYHDPETLTARIRSQLGRLVSHPSAIEVNVRDDAVVLSGPILASEVDRLIEAVRSIPEVPHVESQLEVHEQAGNVAALQGPGRRKGQFDDQDMRDWPPGLTALATIAKVAVGAKILMILGPRRWAPMALGTALAMQTVRLWRQECREAADRKSRRSRNGDSMGESHHRGAGEEPEGQSQQSHSASSGEQGSSSSRSGGRGGESSTDTPGAAPTAGVSPGEPRQAVIHDV